MKLSTSDNGFRVRRLYGDDKSQQYSSTAFSSIALKPDFSNASIRFDLPSILSYNVPFGILYKSEACVNRIFCLTTDEMASRNCVGVQDGAFNFIPRDDAFPIKLE